MNRKILFIFLLFPLSMGGVFAQLETEDSLNLHDFNTNAELQGIRPEFPLAKDFDLYIAEPDSMIKKIDFEKLPPAVFKLYFNEPIEIVVYQSFCLKGIENYAPDRPVPLAVTDPLSKGQAGGGVRYMVNISHLIDYYFLGNKHKSKW